MLPPQRCWRNWSIFSRVRSGSCFAKLCGSCGSWKRLLCRRLIRNWTVRNWRLECGRRSSRRMDTHLAACRYCRSRSRAADAAGTGLAGRVPAAGGVESHGVHHGAARQPASGSQTGRPREARRISPLPPAKNLTSDRTQPTPDGRHHAAENRLCGSRPSFRLTDHGPNVTGNSSGTSVRRTVR